MAPAAGMPAAQDYRGVRSMIPSRAAGSTVLAPGLLTDTVSLSRPAAERSAVRRQVCYISPGGGPLRALGLREVRRA